MDTCSSRSTSGTKYIDPAYRDRAPAADHRHRRQGAAARRGPGARAARRASASSGPSAPGRAGPTTTTMKYVEGRPGGFDPHARIPDMDLDGIDAAFLYPSVGLFAGAVEGARPGRRRVPRLQPLAGRLLPSLSRPALRRGHAADAVDRRWPSPRCATRARSSACAAASSRPNPYNDRMLHHPDYEPFWREVEELDVAIGLHEGASGGMPQVGVDRFDHARGPPHHLAHHGDDAGRA